jgi:choline-sulfatase
MRINVHPQSRGGRNSYPDPIPNPFDQPRFRLWDNFPYFLHNAGYRTAHIGKWHLGPGNPGFFDTWRSFNSQMFHWVGEPHHSDYRPDIQTDFGIEFIEANASRPFFLYQSYYPPHEPYDPPTRFLERYSGKDIEPRGYYANVSSLDWNVGRLLDVLRRHDILDRTFIIFATEHGMTLSGRPGTEKDGYSSPYDEVSRIPLLMRFPPALRPSTVWRSGVSLVDLMPTILDAAGVYGRLGADLRGRSLLPHLESGRDAWRGPLVMQNVSRRQLGGAYFEDRAIRIRQWKLILRKFEGPSEGPAAELYDVEADPAESHNLYTAAEHRPVAADLAAQLGKWGEDNQDALSVELAAGV